MGSRSNKTQTISTSNRQLFHFSITLTQPEYLLVTFMRRGKIAIAFFTFNVLLHISPSWSAWEAICPFLWGWETQPNRCSGLQHTGTDAQGLCKSFKRSWGKERENPEIWKLTTLLQVCRRFVVQQRYSQYSRGEQHCCLPPHDTGKIEKHRRIWKRFMKFWWGQTPPPPG